MYLSSLSSTQSKWKPVGSYFQKFYSSGKLGKTKMSQMSLLSGDEGCLRRLWEPVLLTFLQFQVPQDQNAVPVTEQILLRAGAIHLLAGNCCAIAVQMSS